MTNDIGIAHDDLIAKRATGAHGQTGMEPEQQVQEQRIVSGGRRRGSDVGARACELEMQHIEHARGELDELRAMRTFASVRKARITRASLAFPCSRRVPRSHAWCSQCARDVVTSAKMRAVPCSVTVPIDISNG